VVGIQGMGFRVSSLELGDKVKAVRFRVWGWVSGFGVRNFEWEV
jgi:hypothetical protein